MKRRLSLAVILSMLLPSSYENLCYTVINNKDCFSVLDTEKEHIAGFKLLDYSVSDESNIMLNFSSSYFVGDVYSHSKEINLSILEQKQNSFKVFVTLLSKLQKISFDICSLSNNKINQLSIYCVRINGLIYISTSSYDDCYDAYYKLFDSNDFSHDMEKYFSSEYSCDTVRKQVTNSTYNSISGQLRWLDEEGSYHPCQYMKVSIYDKDPVGSQLLGSVETDWNGNYSFRYTNDMGIFENGYDIYCKFYVGNDYLQVKTNAGADYVYTTEVYNNVPIGDQRTMNFTFTMDSGIGQAMQIAQAAAFSERYAYFMHHDHLSKVNIIYPYNVTADASGCMYYKNSKTIYIEAPSSYNSSASVISERLRSYSSWDVIAHEYGHHIAAELDLDNSTGGQHYILQNAMDEYDIWNSQEGVRQTVTPVKDEAIRLTWSEGLATYFALSTHRYFAYDLQTILGANDKLYSAYNISIDIDIESPNTFLGEGYEFEIASFLHDLCDSASCDGEEFDLIFLDHQNLFDYIVDSNAVTLSQFVNYLYNNTVISKHSIGKLLEHVGVVVRNINCDVQNNILAVSWTGTGGSVDHPYNRFKVDVVDRNENILYSQYTTSSLVNINQSNLSTSLSLDDLYVMVTAYQYDTPITGGYMSDMYKIM